MRVHRRGFQRLMLAYLLSTLFAATTFAIGGTISFFKQSDEMENYLYVQNYNVELIDVFDNRKFALPGDTVNKDVAMENTGDGNAIIRIQLTPSWTPATDALGNALDPDAVTIGFSPTLGTDWTLLSDGWYYYNKILAPGETTNLLVDELTFTPVSNDSHTVDYSNAEYALNVTAQSLQALNAASEEIWMVNYVVDVGGNLIWTTLP